MIIDYTQNRDSIDISFVNDNKQIQMITAPLKFGYYNYVSAQPFEKDNPNIIQNLKSFKNDSLIKKEPSKYFEKHNINEFFNKEIEIHQPNIHKDISKLLVPNPFSCDIETDITQEFGYSTPEKAENKILSISITDSGLNSLYFMLENPNQPLITEIDKLNIESLIGEALGDEYKNAYEYNFEIRIFKSEVEMLNVFLECINQYFHSIFGWNFTTFDWIYIFNRCKRLGIDIRKASPIFKTIKKKLKARKKAGEDTEVEIILPAHRLVNDYMTMFKQSLIYNNLGSYSLNSIAEMILGLKKIMYTGNLRTLYQQDPNKFIAYAIIDTILVMLIHKKTNLYDVDFFEAYFNGIAYNKISQNTISEALVYNELRGENIFLLSEEYNVTVKQKYEGGYVKLPLQKIIEACIGVDFSGLYPNSIITIGISPERKVDTIKVDANGYPKTQEDMDIWLKYKAQNCCLSPLGRIYSLEGGDGLFPRIEKKLIAQRKIFKGHAEDIYLNVKQKITERIKELKALEAQKL